MSCVDFGTKRGTQLASTAAKQKQRMNHGQWMRVRLFLSMWLRIRGAAEAELHGDGANDFEAEVFHGLLL